MKTLRLFGWPLLILGLVVMLGAILYLVVMDEQIEPPSIMASTARQFAKAAELERRRARLTAWPILLVGGGLALAGLVLLEVRRRAENR